MKTIRFSIMISGRAIATTLWYDGSITNHFSTTDFRIDTLSPGTYYVTVAAHLLHGTTMVVLIDDITDISNPTILFTATLNQPIVNFRQPYNVE
jgi:hypothetical protein